LIDTLDKRSIYIAEGKTARGYRTNAGYFGKAGDQGALGNHG
jgi:hypothetical protein